MEPRLLLSGAVLGELPDLTEFTRNSSETYTFNPVPGVDASATPGVSGVVYRDVDADGLRDPFERALGGVAVFVDLDRDGLQSGDELGATTGIDGSFYLPGLAGGEHLIRVVMPDGYRASVLESDAVVVTVPGAGGVSGVSFALTASGHDLDVDVRDVALAEKMDTGTRVMLPVIVTNRGDRLLEAGNTRLRVYVSSDAVLGSDDIRLAKVPLGQDLRPGESVKKNLRVFLPGSLADFSSYLIVETSGSLVHTDLNTANNVDTSGKPILFAGTSEPTVLNDKQLDRVLDNWITTVPYGGLSLGTGLGGFTGIDDLNSILGNWNRGSGGTLIINPIPDVFIPGEPAVISGLIFNDKDGNGSRSSDEIGLEGFRVYLDENNNRWFDSDEVSVLTAADGSYAFDAVATRKQVTLSGGVVVLGSTVSDSTSDTEHNTVDVETTYRVRAVLPSGWREASDAGEGHRVGVESGDVVTGIDFGFYTPPQIDRVVVAGGYLRQRADTKITAEGVNDPDGEIQSVAFYFDVNDDGTADNLLGVDRDGSDGYSVFASGEGAYTTHGYGQVFAVVQDDSGHREVDTAFVRPRLAVELTAGKRLLYRNADGSVMKLSLTGPGSAEVLLKGQGLKVYDFGGVLEVTGQAAADRVELVGTNGRSRLNISTSGGGSHAQFAGKLTGEAVLGVLSARKITFKQSIEMTGRGVIRSLVAHQLNGLTMQGDQLHKGITIKAGLITERVSVNSPIKRLEAGRIDRADIYAPSAEQVRVRRDFTNGRLWLTDPSAELSLDTLTVGRHMNGVYVKSQASINEVRAKAMIDSVLLVGTEVQGQSVSAYSIGFTQRATLKQLTVAGGVYHDSYVAAWRLGTVALDDITRDDPNRLHGVVYKRLGRYVGPSLVTGLRGPESVSEPALTRYKPVFVPFPDH